MSYSNPSQCRIRSCNEPKQSLEFCKNHYEKFQRFVKEQENKAQMICAVTGCNDIVLAMKLCHRHYARWRYFIEHDPFHGRELTTGRRVTDKRVKHATATTIPD